MVLGGQRVRMGHRRRYRNASLTLQLAQAWGGAPADGTPVIGLGGIKLPSDKISTEILK